MRFNDFMNEKGAASFGMEDGCIQTPIASPRLPPSRAPPPARVPGPTHRKKATRPPRLFEAPVPSRSSGRRMG